MLNYDLKEKIYNVRMAGRIRRLHIRPMNGEQNVAAHTWGLAMILLDIHPDVSKEGLVFALRHDVAEVSTGDIPANVKWANPKLDEMLEKQEKAFMHRMGWLHKLRGPNAERDAFYIKMADRIELVFYCLEEMYMGNFMLTDVYENAKDKIQEELDHLTDPEDRERIREYIAAYSEFLAENFSKKAISPRDVLSIS